MTWDGAEAASITLDAASMWFLIDVLPSKRLDTAALSLK
jgi:hypothetical protein